jgi:DNA repair exonuclease SbcCD ATPase subunit
MENKLSVLKDGLAKAKDMRYKAELKKDALLKQQEEILEQIRAEQVDPGLLDQEIEKLEREIAGLAQEVQELIPWDLINKAGQ